MIDLDNTSSRTSSLKRRLLEQCAGQQGGIAALLLDDAWGPCVLIDASRCIVRINHALGSSLPSPLALPGSDIAQLFVPDGRQSAMAHIAQVLWGKTPVLTSFTAVLGSVAEPRTMLVCILPLREAHGEISGALLRLTDYTERLALDAQLAHSQRLQATGQLAGGIAHDFNNLITAILGAAEGILERRHGGATQEDACQIRDTARRGAALVRKLLGFGQQQMVRPRALSVNDAIASVSGLLQRLLGARVRLVVEFEQPGRNVLADPTQLDQVLVNLVVNARDAMPDGGEITLRSGHITLYRPRIAGTETMPPGSYVTIEVQDRGTGIPTHVLPHIFEPFFTTKRERGGSGLGLSSVHGIISRSNGYLTVETEPGAGTSMRIFLPRWDGPPPPLHTQEPGPASVSIQPGPTSANSRGVVLLTDDESTVRKLAQRALARAGWDVIEAESGEAALESLRLRPSSAPIITALISDMVMPGMTGLELADFVRTACARPSLPVIFMSGYAKVPVRSGIAQAATHFLPKPYRLADLVAALDKATRSGR
jgi:two-component system cell cycle sensor histidine kinase/response regulator CckA